MNNLTLAKISETEAFLEKNASNISKEQWKSILENTELSENFIDKNGILYPNIREIAKLV